MEPVDPDLLARGLHNQRFQLIWDRIVRQKICKRETKDQQVITNKMLDKHPEYKYHHHYQKTFSQLNRYDHWLIAALSVSTLLTTIKEMVNSGD